MLSPWWWIFYLKTSIIIKVLVNIKHHRVHGELPRLLCCCMPQYQPLTIWSSHVECIILLVYNRLTLSFIFIIMSLHISCTHRIILAKKKRNKREGGKNKLQNCALLLPIPGFKFMYLSPLCAYFHTLIAYSHTEWET